MNRQKGFTLVELLVVIAIIGLLSTLAIVALNSARAKARDARRVSDIKQVQTALELFQNDFAAYPIEAAAITLGSATDDCLSSQVDVSDDPLGFVATASCGADPYMGLVPDDPGTTAYTYHISTGTTYCIEFVLEGTTGGLDAGDNFATPSGISATDCSV